MRSFWPWPLAPLIPLLLLVDAVRCAPTPLPPVNGCDLSFGGVALRGRQTDGACRYTLRYGWAERWAQSRAPDSLFDQDTTALPPACPQDASLVVRGAPSQNEDCLFGTVYVPRGVKAGDKMPVFVWVHGGSYIAGSASAPGLDGSSLANKGQMIVVVVQYRLGVLGMLPPADMGPAARDPNLALGDVILALQQIQKYVGLLGGDGNRITIGGQSSGSSLVRALLASPSASGLFRAAVLQSDPMTYGTASPTTTRQLQDLYYSSPQLSECKDIQCLRRKSLQDILAAQTTLIVRAPETIKGVPLVTPLRPTHNTPLLPRDDPSQISSFPSGPGRIPLLITTTSNEGGSVTQALFPSPIPPDNTTYAALLGLFVGPERATSILGPRPNGANNVYALNGPTGRDILRTTFERLVTDGVWRCASRDFARRWASAGGAVWVGEWAKGVRYPSNEGGSYCTGDRVCHEDDIFPTFSSAQGVDALQDDVVRRWSSFIHNLDPNIAVNVPASLSPGGGSNIALPPTLEAPPRPSVRPPWREPGKDGTRFIPARPAAIGEVVRVGPGSVAAAAGSGPGSGSGTGMGMGTGIGVSVGSSAASLQVHVKRQTRTPGARWARYTAAEGTGVGSVYSIGGWEVKSCPAGVWGEAVRFDWQIYG